MLDRDENQNVGGLIENGSYQKQNRKNRVEKSERSWQTHIQEKWIGQVDCRMSKGAKRFETQRIRCYWWQIGARKGFLGRGSLVLQKNEVKDANEMTIEKVSHKYGGFTSDSEMVFERT